MKFVVMDKIIYFDNGTRFSMCGAIFLASSRTEVMYRWDYTKIIIFENWCWDRRFISRCGNNTLFTLLALKTTIIAV